MEIRLNCLQAQFYPVNFKSVEVALEGVEKEDILDNFSVEDFCDHIQAIDLLAEIDERNPDSIYDWLKEYGDLNKIKKYFNLREIDDEDL